MEQKRAGRTGYACTIVLTAFALVTCMAGANAAISATSKFTKPTIPLTKNTPIKLPMGKAWYVDHAKGDDNNDGSEGAPFKTVAAAIRNLQPGHRLYLRAGTYPKVTIGGLRGTPENPILIASHPGEHAIIDGGFPEFRTVPNTAWEKVKGGHPDEWRSVRRYPDHSVFGQIIDKKVRLIAYSRIEDLRAKNESLAWIDESDPRPGMNTRRPNRRETNHPMKVPWTYFGPGVYWDKKTGRIHIRLSHTKIKAPGITNYTGETDPRKVALSIAAYKQVTASISVNHVIFQHLTFQNGGNVTVTVNGGENTIFDHVKVYGARIGLRMGVTKGTKFLHCLFDGGLAPWTFRQEVKNGYTYIKPDGTEGNSGTGRMTSDLLFLSGPGSEMEIAYCEFRHGHDAIYLYGTDTLFHHNLIEDMNDEGLFLGGSAHADNIHIFQNVLRQVLSPISFAAKGSAGKRRYIHRNIIDQRVPTRGHRILPPDVARPYLWRYGHDFKMNLPVGPFYCYQNTFIASDFKRNASWVWGNIDVRNKAERWFLNNIHVSMRADVPLSYIPPPQFPGKSDGNLWWRTAKDISSPAFIYPKYARKAGGQIKDFAALATSPIFQAFKAKNGVGWEASSLYAAPGFSRFAGKPYNHQVPFPNDDLRPAKDSPAIAAGIILPETLFDPLRPADGAHPDIGALPHNVEPLRIGIEGRHSFPELAKPVAVAGTQLMAAGEKASAIIVAHPTLVDEDKDGVAEVTLDASQSRPGRKGSIVGYRWRNNGKLIAKTSVATVQLPVGIHELTLAVKDTFGAIGRDVLTVTVKAMVEDGDCLVNGGFEKGKDGWTQVRGGAWTVPGHAHSGQFALKLQGTPITYRLMTQRVNVQPGKTYEVSGWIKAEKLQNPVILGVDYYFSKHKRKGNAAHLWTQVRGGAWTVGTAVGTQPYTKHSKTFVIPADIHYLELWIRTKEKETGNAYIDDLSVKPVK